MISGLGNSIGASMLQQMRERMFSRVDSDGDGSISKTEFASGRPQGASESDAADRFAQIDGDSDGSLSTS